MRAAWCSERAFRCEVLAFFFFSLPVSAWIAVSVWGWLVLNALTCLVMVVELLNTAVEKAIDRQGLQRDHLAAFAKDAGSAAVFVTLMIWLAVWGVYLFNPAARF